MEVPLSVYVKFPNVAADRGDIMQHNANKILHPPKDCVFASMVPTPRNMAEKINVVLLCWLISFLAFIG
jgi:hypothetical protein